MKLNSFQRAFAFKFVKWSKILLCMIPVSFYEKSENKSQFDNCQPVDVWWVRCICHELNLMLKLWNSGSVARVVAHGICWPKVMLVDKASWKPTSQRDTSYLSAARLWWRNHHLARYFRPVRSKRLTFRICDLLPSLHLVKIEFFWRRRNSNTYNRKLFFAMIYQI